MFSVKFYENQRNKDQINEQKNILNLLHVNNKTY